MVFPQSPGDTPKKPRFPPKYMPVRNPTAGARALFLFLRAAKNDQRETLFIYTYTAYKQGIVSIGFKGRYGRNPRLAS